MKDKYAKTYKYARLALKWVNMHWDEHTYKEMQKVNDFADYLDRRERTINSHKKKKII